MEQAKPASANQRATRSKADAASEGQLSKPAGSFDFTIDRSLDSLLRSAADIIATADEISRLISSVAAERDRMTQEIERARREREVLTACVRELKIATEVETAEMRERARRESQAILAEAQEIRARALENAKRLEARLVTAEKRARILLRELLSSAEAADAAKAELELDSANFPAGAPTSPTAPQPDRPPERPAPPPTHDRSTSSEQRAPEPAATVPTVAPDQAPAGEGWPPHEPVSDPWASFSFAHDGYLPDDQSDADTVSLTKPLTPAEPEPATVAGPETAVDAEMKDFHAVFPTPTSRHQLLIRPVHSFGKIEEVEKRLGEINGVESVRITALQSNAVTFEVVHTSRGDFLEELTTHLPNARVVRAEKAELELELAEPLGAR